MSNPPTAQDRENERRSRLVALALRLLPRLRTHAPSRHRTDAVLSEGRGGVRRLGRSVAGGVMTLARFRAENHPQQTGKRGAKDAVDDRETLPEHFAEFDRQYGPFTLDVAAAAHNAKCERYWTREQNGLISPWRGVVWCNPPYSDLAPWLEKAWAEWAVRNPTCMHATDRRRLERIVMLLPANRTEQVWWQTWVEPFRDRDDFAVRFLPGRMRFIRPDAVIGPKGDRPPFGNCLLIWDRSS